MSAFETGAPGFGHAPGRSSVIISSSNRWSDGPTLFVFNQCRQFIRMVPALPRDELDMDDVDYRAEDHVGDETRYRPLTKEHTAVVRQI